MEVLQVAQVDDIGWKEALGQWVAGQVGLGFSCDQEPGPVDPVRMAALKAAAPAGKIQNVDFGGAIFKEDVDLRDVTLLGDRLTFDGAVFDGASLLFDRSRIRCTALGFQNVQFSDGTLSFRKARLDCKLLSFSGAKFGAGTVSFRGSRIRNCEMILDSVDLTRRRLDFDSCKTEGVALDLKNAKLSRDVILTGANLAATDVCLDGATLQSALDMSDSKLSGVRIHMIGSTVTSGARGLDLRRATFCDRPVSVRAQSESGAFTLDLEHTRVECDLTLAMGRCTVSLAGAIVRAPVRVHSLPEAGAPSVATLDAADIGDELTLGRGVDLKDTIWGDSDLSLVRLTEPTSLRIVNGRRVLGGHVQGIADKKERLVLERNYRDLRVNLESAARMHMANDFYYWETEARRRSASRSSAIWWVLTTYKVVSAYGTRTMRALMSWLLLTAVGTLALRINGIDIARDAEQVSLYKTWRLVVDLCFSGIREANTPSLSFGETLIGVCARILSPAILGLAVLALRNQARR